MLNSSKTSALYCTAPRSTVPGLIAEPLSLARENLVHQLGDLFQPLAAAAGNFGRGPAVIADLAKGRHHGVPVVVAFQQLHAKTFAEPFLAHFLQAELLDVDLQNALTQHA